MTIASHPLVFLVVSAIVGSAAFIAEPTQARSLNLIAQNAQVSKRVKPARPMPAPREVVRKISTQLSCQGEGESWTCPGIAEPGTEAFLSYTVTIKK